MERILLCIAACLTAAAVLVSCSNGGSGTSVGGGDSKSGTERDESVIYVALSPDTEPFEYIDDDGDYNGFDVALAMKIGEELGRKPIFVERSRDDLLSSLSCGIADIAVSSLEVSDASRQKVDFTDKYITLSSSIIKKAGNSAITDIASLKNYRVGVVADSAADKYLTDDMGFVSIIRYRNISAAGEGFFAGGCDALFVDDYLTDYITDESSSAVVVQSGIGRKEYCIAVDKGNSDMIKRLNEILLRLGADGTMLDLREAYLGTDAELRAVFTSEVKSIQ